MLKKIKVVVVQVQVDEVIQVEVEDIVQIEIVELVHVTVDIYIFSLVLLLYIYTYIYLLHCPLSSLMINVVAPVRPLASSTR